VVDDACVAAAILAEGDIRSAAGATFGHDRRRDVATERSDLQGLVERFLEVEEAGLGAGPIRASGLDPGSTHAVARAAKQLARAARRASATTAGGTPDAALGMAILAGYPDRVARRVRPGSRSLALAGGGVAQLAESSAVRDAEWMVALDAEERAAGLGGGRPTQGGVVVRMASAIEPEWLIELFPDAIVEQRAVSWNAQLERVEARDTMLWDGLVLHASEAAGASPEETARVLSQAALAKGARTFAAEGELDRWLARARFAATVDASIVAPDDDAVAAVLTRLCEGRSSFAELREAGLLRELRSTLGARAATVDRLAPERVTLSGGRSVAIDYQPGKPPRIASRLQDFFGMTDGPRVGEGRVPLVLELCAPNGRAVQVTTDLAGFWQRHYRAVRAELMRRYPRHSWPDDPTKPAPRMRPR
jgi:ATP-dependent helicase HrpB